MIEIDWISSLLEQNSQREITKYVWRYNNKVIATNGVGLIALDADSTLFFDLSEYSPCPDAYRQTLSEILNNEYRSITSYNMEIDLQDFKQWLGKPESATKCDCKMRKCPKCNGKGTIKCNLGEEHECDECDGGAEFYCDKCVDGWIKPKPRYIGIFDVVINGNVLAQYLENLCDGHVIVSCNGEKPVRFSGDGWDVYIMPVRDVKGEVRKYDSKRPNRNVDGI